MKLLVVCPNWVGDLVMATPALRALRRGFAGADIAVLVRPCLIPVLEGNRSFDRLLRYDPRGTDRAARAWPLVRALRRERFDVAVLLTNSWRSAALVWLARARWRAGYRRDGRGILLTDRLPATREPAPVIDYYLALAYHLGCPPETYKLDLATTRDDEAAADAVWRKFGIAPREPVVVLNPGGAYGSAKHWPAEHFAALARRLASERGLRVLVVCGPAERESSREIAARADDARVVSLADEHLGLGLTKACIRRAALVVTTDSGPRHFAAAFGVPCVALFGPTHQAWSENYHPREVRLQKEVPCGPCQLRTCPLDHRCMQELRPQQVFDAAMGLLIDDRDTIAA